MEKFQFERNTNEDLFKQVLSEFYDDLAQDPIDNQVCSIRHYDWKDEDKNCLESGGYNLYHKPSGFKLTWYKYPLRGAEANMNITHEQFKAILMDCKKSIDENASNSYFPWWSALNGNGKNASTKLTSFYIGGLGSGIEAKSKEEFLKYLSEEIDRAEELGVYDEFDVEIHLGCRK